MLFSVKQPASAKFLYGLILAVLVVVAGFAPAPASATDATIAPLATKSLLLDGQLIGERLVVVGERGHILTSDDFGHSWEQRPAPTDVTLTSLYFIDEKTGWAAGHDAVILRTDDGGENWRQLYSDPEDERPILDLWFRDVKTGYAIGGYGLFLVTEDGGRSWEPVDFAPAVLRFGESKKENSWSQYEEEEAWGIDFHLNQLVRDRFGRLFVAAEAGNLYRSDDNSRSWVSLPSPYDGSFYGMLPLQDGSLLFYGLRGHLFHSVDAGFTLKAIDTGTHATLNDALRLTDGRIVVAGLAGTLLLSHDNGQSFSRIKRTERLGIARILETPDHALLLIGEGGAVRYQLPAAVEGAK
ncbi:MAG: YCF48-related protein [Desulfuromonadales bacterium]|nr:YCF48-related protein [Desulfuromonadales bacterium]